MKAKRTVIIIVCLAVLAGLWGVRHEKVNRHWEELYAQNTKKEFKMGDVVPFGDDSTSNGLNLKGYSVRVESMKLLDADEFSSEYKLDPAKYFPDFKNPPKKYAVVDVELANSGSTAEGVLLGDLTLYGVDFYLYCDQSLTAVVNQFADETAAGISVPDGKKARITLVYPFNPYPFTGYALKAVDSREMWLTVTSYPTRKFIRVQ